MIDNMITDNKTKNHKKAKAISQTTLLKTIISAHSILPMVKVHTIMMIATISL